ncbi:MAG: hypothetical protein AAF752_13220, partial [Bacteroidota bacterium]
MYRLCSAKKYSPWSALLFSLFFGLNVSVSTASAQSQIGPDIDGEAGSDNSGFSVSISSDGTRVAIGAYLNDGTDTSAGHVRVFDLVGSSWTQVGSDIDGEAGNDQSGFSVSISPDGSRVAIGSPQNNGPDDGTVDGIGQVRVYELIGGSWTQVGADIEGEAGGDGSGRAVSLSSDGSRVAIGATANDGTAASAGHVRVFDLVAGSWTQVGGDIDGEAFLDRFGTAVSLSSDGTRVAVGTPFSSSFSGSVRVFELIGGAWTQLGSTINSERSSDRAGQSVSLSADGSRVAIGANRNSDNGGNAGHVRVFEFGSGVWTQVGVDIDGEASGDESGFSVSISGDGSRVAIGAPLNAGGGGGSGHARVYQLVAGTWTQVGVDVDGEFGGDRFGDAVALSGDGNTLAVGASQNGGNGSAAGHVRVFDLSTPLPVQFAEFIGTTDEQQVSLAWSTLGETDNAGFWVEHRPGESDGSGSDAEWNLLGFVDGAGTTTERQTYRFLTSELSPGTHAFRLQQVDFDGTFAYSLIVNVEVGVPGTHLFGAAYPNPFAQKTTLRVSVSRDQEIDLAVFDELG